MNNDQGASDSSRAAFFALISNPLKFKLFLFRKLPAAYFSGLRVKELSENICIVTVPYKWFTQNPFRSTYFACLAMAAEMSTGILAMANTYKRSPAVSMLVVGMEGKFYKKASGITHFICNSGFEIKNTVNEAIVANEGRTIRILSSGYNENKELVSEFWITWSFKSKNS
ncbi:MAG TPA: DUF4442 domain-containing protein [Flavisolibacter sp.]|nr:DUF4442 domain-containing protein [Flavisolibacter sp.]